MNWDEVRLESGDVWFHTFHDWEVVILDSDGVDDHFGWIEEGGLYSDWLPIPLFLDQFCYADS